MPPDNTNWSRTQAAEISRSEQQLDNICDRFELSWRESRSPRIDVAIEEVPAPLKRPLLTRLVALDLEGRWRYAKTAETVDRSADDSQAGDALPLRPRLEDYARCFSALLQLDELPAELIAQEYRVRHRWGDQPDHAEYIIRFASLAESILPSLVQVDAELASEGQARAPAGADDTWPLESRQPPSASKFPDVPGYEILGVLGRGGMGVVYRARQSRLNRMVALKMILAGHLATPEDISRFRSEAAAAAKLDHVGIVPIFEVGGDGVQHFFSMAFVEGKSLADRVARGPLLSRDAATMVEQIAVAVEYAHRHGIIHRDLKPRNILLTTGGQPKITDFGLAKNLDADQAQTASGQILGTPGYMSPEQARGKASAIGPRSDVYSLGAILYCLLTGRPPFHAGGVMETLRQVVECEPVSPRLLNPAVTRDLETICLRCLAKEPEQRLSSAQDLADELGRTLRGEPIRSRRIGPVGRAWRWARRKPLAAALCVAVVVICAALWAAGHFAGRVNRSQELTLLLGEFEIEIDRLNLSKQPLANLDALAARIERLSPPRAAQAKSRLNQSFAKLIEQALRAPKLADEELSAVEAAIGMLKPRDPARADGLGKALDQRRSQWQTLFDLQPPFKNWEDAFGPSITIDGPKQSLVYAGAAAEKDLPARRLLTSAACGGDAQIEATFAESWQAAKEVGLELNATDEGGYSFVLRLPPQVKSDNAEEAVRAAPLSFAAARAAGGLVIEEIRRNGLALVRRSRAASDLPEGPLRLSAWRQRDRLFFQVNALSPLRFSDPFMLAGESGVFGVRWPPDASLKAVRAQNRSQPFRHSALEAADRAYDQGQFSDALTLYRTQLATGADDRYQQESSYKSALCLAALNRNEEAAAVFGSLLGESGERWPPLAGCQLWVARLRQGRAAETEDIFQTMSGRFSVEQLAAITPADVRDEIVKSYRGEINSLGAVLRFSPQRVAHVERALAIDRFLNESGGDPALPFELMRAYQSRGDFDRALELFGPLADKNPWDADMQRQYIRLLCLMGKSREALKVVDQRLREAPAALDGFRQMMLLARSRTNAALEDFENAESDVDSLLSQPLTQQYYREYIVSYAYLLQGVLRERRGDIAGAREAWRQGFAKHKELLAALSPGTGSWLCLQMLGSLADELTDNDVAQAMEHVLADAGASPVVRLARQLAGPQIYSPVFRRMWRSPRGRALAADFALDRLAINQRYRLPIELAASEMSRSEIFGGDWASEQEELVNQTIDAFYLAIVERGTLGKTVLAQLALAWKGISGGLGWAGAAPALDPVLRGQVAYLLAHRYLKLARGADARKFFRDAIAAVPDSPAAELARADLDLLSAGRGMLLVENEAPHPVDLLLQPAGDEARLLKVDRRGQAALPPDKYRLLFAGPQDDLVISPDEIEVSAPSRRTVRILWRWKPSEPGRSLPGLASRPSSIEGFGRWQIETRQPRGFSAVARSPDGRQLAVASIDGRVRFFAADSMSLTGLLAGHDLAVSSLAYQPGGALLATGSNDGTVRLWRVANGQLDRVLRGHHSTVTCLAWSRDGRWLASVGFWNNGAVCLWRATGEHLATVNAGGNVRSAAIHPEGLWLATAGSISNDIRLWHADGKAGPTLVGHAGSVASVAFSPDGRWLASGGADKTVRLWDTARWQTTAEIDPGDAAVSVVAWSHNGDSLAVGTESGSVTIYAAHDRSPLWQGKATGPLRSIDWNSDDTELTTCTGWERVNSWRAADGHVGALAEWLAPHAKVIGCSADGRRFAIADYETISLGDVTGQAGPTIHAFSTGWLAFDPRNHHLASLSWQGRLQVWNAASGAAVWTCPEPLGPQRAFAFSSDGQQIATAGDDRIVRIWAVAGEPIAELPAQDDAILSLAFSPDDRRLAIGLGDEQKQVRLWELQPPKAGPALSGHAAGITTIAWCPDGQRLATAGHDNTIRIWQVDGRPGPVLDPQRGWQISVAWSPDGEWLASSDYYGCCRLWRADGTPGAVLERSLAPNSSVAFNTETGNLLVLGNDSTIKTYQPADGQWLTTTLLLSAGRSVVIGAGGDVQSASPQAGDELLYFVETPGRGCRLLSTTEFQRAIRLNASRE